MPNQILVPALGESVTEATVSKWLKQVGEKVESDEPLVELETDKVNVEVPSPLSGTLSSIKVKEGSTVEVGALLGVINELKSNIGQDNKEESNDQKSYIPPETKPKKKLAKNKKPNFKEEKKLNLNNKNKIKNEDTLVLDTLAEEIETENVSKEVDFESPPKEVEEERYVPPKSKKNLSPSVRKIVEENSIDISNIEGTGKSGRISKGDLINLMGSMPGPSARRVTHGQEERVKMTRLRATIARRLKESQESSATLSTFNEVDMQNIIEMRKNYQEDFKKKYSVKLGFMSFFVKASVVALKNFPAINAEIENDHIIYKNYYNISQSAQKKDWLCQF